MVTSLMLAILFQTLPAEAQKISTQADAKLEALRKAYEKACTEVKIREAAELQRVYDSIKKADATGAAVVKAKIDALMADANVAAKGMPTVVQWLQGKWIFSGVVDKNFGEVWEFKGEEVIGAGIGDRVRGKILIDGGKIQILWNSGLVEFLRVPDSFGDEASGVSRTGEMKAKRMK
jgi:hypothetical protein